MLNLILREVHLENNYHISITPDGKVKKLILGPSLTSAVKGGKQLCVIKYSNPKIVQPAPYFYPVIGEEVMESDFDNQQSDNPILLRSSISKEEYVRKVNELKKHIKLGDIYEINFCINFFAENVQIDPLSVFYKLYRLSKAPYSCLAKLSDTYIISASPELFLEKTGSLVFTKPIKGTVKRGVNKEQDETFKLQLYNSLKERTENVMAVDVARNDLSKVAERGTVKVNKLYNIESFETVHQMVSTVSCILKPSANFEEIISATFPMASMTGAPKIKAMELIDLFEGFKREFYSGALGFINESEDFKLAVLIRSIFYNSSIKKLTFAVGSAITHLCEPEQEYEECLLKANALVTALNAKIEN